MNGDTHCYLCNGTGVAITYTAEAREQQTQDAQFASDLHFRLVGGYHSFNNKIRQPIREATEVTGYIREGDDRPANYEELRAEDSRRAHRLERRITFWLDELPSQVQESRRIEREAAEAAAIAEFKAQA
jgi:hypothetical protein